MFIPSKKLAVSIAKEYGTPVFVTDAGNIRERAKTILDAFSSLNMKVFYAMKANYNPHIVRIIKDAGVYGVDTVSVNEIRLALELGYAPDQIIFTPSNPNDEEMRFAGEKGVLQNLGSLSEIERFGKMFPGRDFSVRVSPEVGAGECAKVTTGQSESKFGVTLEQMQTVKEIARKRKMRLIGIHSHIGSGFYRSREFVASVRVVCDIAKDCPDVRVVDFGGGFGVTYHPKKKEIDLGAFARSITPIVRRFERETGRALELRIEPGKFLVTQSTALLTRVTTIKEKKRTTFVGVDAGFYNLVRPAMYGAYHHVINTSRPKEKTQKVKVVGNVCETCDVFNEGIRIGKPREGDVLAILCAGGYGSAMSSNYTMRPFAPEILVDGNAVTLTRKRQSYEEMMTGYQNI